MLILGGFATNGGTSIFVLSCGILSCAVPVVAGVSTAVVWPGYVVVPGNSKALSFGCTIGGVTVVTLIGSFTVVFPVVGISIGVSFGRASVRSKLATGKGFLSKSLA